MAMASAQIWGISLDLMNKMSVTQRFFFEQRPWNKLTIWAGDEDGMSICFVGGVQEAWADGRQMPDMAFYISAMSGLIDGSKTILPTSFKGSVDVAVVVESIAQQMQYGFKNWGVSAILNNPYKPGAARSQIEAACRAADCRFIIDEANSTVEIWPKHGKRGEDVALVNPDTGLVGYPAFTQGGVEFVTLYNPALAFGQEMRLDSAFTPANGQWAVASLRHQLESNIPGGQWFSTIETSYMGFVA
jgi:hypothetical protein